jgi:hypothetical protein
VEGPTVRAAFQIPPYLSFSAIVGVADVAVVVVGAVVLVVVVATLVVGAVVAVVVVPVVAGAVVVEVVAAVPPQAASNKVDNRMSVAKTMYIAFMFLASIKYIILVLNLGYKLAQLYSR